MKVSRLALFTSVLCLGSMGLAQDAATEVGKGAKDTAKATEVVTKDAAHGTETVAKDTGRVTGKVAEDAGRGTEKGAKTAAHVGKRAGEKSGKGIETGTKDLGKGLEKGTKDVGKGIGKGAKKTAEVLKKAKTRQPGGVGNKQKPRTQGNSGWAKNVAYNHGFVGQAFNSREDTCPHMGIHD